MNEPPPSFRGDPLQWSGRIERSNIDRLSAVADRREAVVALAKCIAVATQGDERGKVVVEVWTERPGEFWLGEPLFDGEFVTAEDRAVFGDVVGNELYEFWLPRGTHRVQVFTAPRGGLANRVCFLLDSRR